MGLVSRTQRRQGTVIATPPARGPVQLHQMDNFGPSLKNRQTEHLAALCSCCGSWESNVDVTWELVRKVDNSLILRRLKWGHGADVTIILVGGVFQPRLGSRAALLRR